MSPSVGMMTFPVTIWKKKNHVPNIQTTNEISIGDKNQVFQMY
jgi:hypothetical protein